MTKHTDEGRSRAPRGFLRVLKGQHDEEAVRNVEETEKSKVSERVLPEYEATAFVGLRTIVHDAAIEEKDVDGEVTIELPKMQELVASAAVARCLMPIRLRGPEIRAMRKIMSLTLADLAGKLDGRTAPETVSRWESEAQPMGGYAEKVLRLFVCEELRKDAPGIEYQAKKIANLKVMDPWRTDPNYEVPAIKLWLLPLKEQCSGAITEAWNEKTAA